MWEFKNFGINLFDIHANPFDGYGFSLLEVKVNNVTRSAFFIYYNRQRKIFKNRDVIAFEKVVRIGVLFFWFGEIWSKLENGWKEMTGDGIDGYTYHNEMYVEEN